MSNTTGSAESTQAYEIKEKLLSLETALLEGTPNMPSLLQDIHRNLKRDPDLVTILSNSECSIIVRGLLKQTNETIATKAIKKAKSTSTKKLTMDDL